MLGSCVWETVIQRLLLPGWLAVACSAGVGDCPRVATATMAENQATSGVVRASPPSSCCWNAGGKYSREYMNARLFRLWCIFEKREFGAARHGPHPRGAVELERSKQVLRKIQEPVLTASDGAKNEGAASRFGPRSWGASGLFRGGAGFGAVRVGCPTRFCCNPLPLKEVSQ